LLIPDAHILAELFERKPKRQLATQRVAVGPNMTKNSEALMFAQDLADLLERGGAHAFFLSSLSICCKISTMREPRAIDSSRCKTKWGVNFIVTRPAICA